MLKLETFNLAEAFGWTLLHSLWQGALIAVILVLIYNLAKPKASEARYALAVGSLLAVLLCSGITFFICLEQSKKLHIELNESASESWALEFDKFELFLSSQAGTEAASKAPWNVAMDFITPYTPWLTWVWLLGFIIFSVRWLMGYLYVQSLRFRHSQMMDFDWQSQLNTLARRMGLNQTLLMFESAKIHSPMTIGHLKPVVLVPVGLLTGMSPLQVEAILAHEIAHIMRNDFLVNLILSFVEGIFFYHPAVWWISERIRQEREHCCDDMAVNITENKKEYAETLALVATHSIHSPKMAMTMQGNKQHLMTRIKRLFQPESHNNRLSGRATFGLIVLMGFSTLAWVSPETAGQMQPKNWAETYDSPVLFSDWIAPVIEEADEVEITTSRSKAEVAEKIFKELENKVYNITRLDSPPPFPPMPPLPNFRGVKLPRNMAMPPMPKFPRSMVLRIDEDMTDEEIEELVEEYEERIEEWQEEYEDAMEEYAELMEEWGEDFGDKFGKEYGEKFGKEYGEKYGAMWERWGEKVAKEIEKGAKANNKEDWMRDLERELSKLGNDLEIRFETNDKKPAKDGYKYEYKFKKGTPTNKEKFFREFHENKDDEYLRNQELKDRLERIRRQEEEERRIEEMVRREEEKARRVEAEARRVEADARRAREEARRVEERARILQERERVREERNREVQALMRERAAREELRTRNNSSRTFDERISDYERRMRTYELGRLERERGKLDRDKAMLEREVRALKGSINRDQDVIFDDDFMVRVERVKKLAKDIEGQISKEEMMRALEAERKAEEERAIRRQILAERQKQDAIRVKYEAEMAAIKRELARAEQKRIDMERQMRMKEIAQAKLEAEKARVEQEKARIAAEKARAARALRPVTSADRVDEKVTKVAEIAKVMKGELVQGGYINPESHVKLSITNGVIMVNNRTLRSDDYAKYQKLIRMMGVNLYDGDTVIEF